MAKDLDQSRIIAVLRDLDGRLVERCRIVMCGGAAAIVGYGLRRFTGDIDIFEPTPKTEEFYKAVRSVLESHGLDAGAINEGAKAFADDLSPHYRERLITLDVGFENLEVSVIGKADLLTMKLCAWREADMQDVERIGISEDDLKIINENLAFLAQHSSDRAHRAELVLAELGLETTPRLDSKEIRTLAELIRFYGQQESEEPSLDQIRRWKEQMSLGSSAAFLAGEIVRRGSGQSRERGMDI